MKLKHSFAHMWFRSKTFSS